MIGKTVVVTGANSGIGRVTALELARKGATVVMICRSRSKGEAARDAIIAESGNQQVELILADFASLSSVRRGAEEFLTRHDRLHVLVNNAGLYLGERLLSQEGHEMTFAVNHLAPFLLTNLLLGALRAAAPARVVTVSSGAHMAGHIRFDDLDSKRGYRGFRAYSDSKLANVLFSNELARRLAGGGVSSNSLHPGAVATNFASGSGGLLGIGFGLMRPFFISPEQGAQTSIYLASSPGVAGVSGQYFAKSRPTRSSAESTNVAVQRRLWEVSEQMTGLVGQGSGGAA
ncbi:SDR family oxidoreductase [Oscillochloris sp. ZM17-4]|uniref:SDR family oxidoreductase n=1 Tax=Oscillochloris sp. ZM17-4 TaxID=2866714 RepID=UPI00351CF69C